LDPAYYVAAGSLKARSYQLDLVANNLANAATVGYKTEKSFFSIYNRAKSDGRGLPLSQYVDDGTVVAESGIDFSQGTLRATGRPLDLALQGNGFFMIQTAQGPFATRDGQFQLGKDGQIQTSDGSALLGKNGLPLRVDPAGGKVAVLADGTVQQGDQTVGQIGLKAFATPAALKRAGIDRFDASGSQEATSDATVTQGSLEDSGVDLATCMIDMIRLNRQFEASMKVASTITNDMDARSISDISTGH
jgi:flagellar basal-body rod protein FlgF